MSLQLEKTSECMVDVQGPFSVNLCRVEIVRSCCACTVPHHGHHPAELLTEDTVARSEVGHDRHVRDHRPYQLKTKPILLYGRSSIWLVWMALLAESVALPVRGG